MSIELESRSELRSARLRSGKNASDLAKHTGGSVSSYYDLENCSGELFMSIDLRDLQGLCEDLGIRVRQLFPKAVTSTVVSPAGLRERVESYLSQGRVDLGSFEDKVNYEIGQFLRDPSTIGDWNLDCLRNVCDAVGVDWQAVLPLAGLEGL